MVDIKVLIRRESLVAPCHDDLLICTALCTILDSEDWTTTGTTLPADAETLLVTGAVGYVTEERIMEEPATRWRIPRALKEWGLACLHDFEQGLQAYAQREAAQHAGVHRLPALR